MKRTVSLCLLLLFPALLPAQEEAARLGDLLRQALDRNPKIRSVGFEAEAMSFRIPQERSLPDPMVSFSLKNMGFPAFTLGQEVMSGVDPEYQLSSMSFRPGLARKLWTTVRE